ncbi:MAG: NERD domain-containing protein [Oscillospiraceae bacterium]|nr:NERD domain-containing protein [Oscillospiraceae bacterium]
METIHVLKLWFETVQNIAAHNWGFLLLIPVIYALRKIKVRRPRTWDVEETPWDIAETPPDTETLSLEQKKGQRGEDFIAQILYDTVPGEFQVFRNVYIPHGGTTSEIDLVMVHETGIFVFESKNYNGVISGSMDAKNWVHIHPNRKKYLFYNPVRQNRNHIRALSDCLQIPETNFYSYVVFSGRCALERVPENTRSVVITQTPDLAEQLEDTLSELPTLYSAEEVQVIAGRLAPLTDVDAAVKAKHIQDIRNQWESDICPFCGAALVLRRGKYGDFWGCSRYPRCRFTRQV